LKPTRRLKNRMGTSLPLPRVPPKLNMPCPSRKKSRFSGNCRVKRVRLTCCRSSSTCAKSVLTVASAMRLRVNPYLKSKPALGEKRLENGAAAARSVVSEETAYGFSSRFIDCAGVSRPTSVPADDTLKRPLWPYARGSCVRKEVSFFHLVIRRKLIPQTCGPDPR